jgi:hypothetical protein
MRRLTRFDRGFGASAASPGTTEVDDRYPQQAPGDDFGGALRLRFRTMLAEETSDLSIDGLHFEIGE